MILTSNLISRAQFYLVDRPSVHAPALHLQAVQPSFSTDSKNISMQDATKQSSTSVFGGKDAVGVSGQILISYLQHGKNLTTKVADRNAFRPGPGQAHPLPRFAENATLLVGHAATLRLDTAVGFQL
jgi:hypothetical protein